MSQGRSQRVLEVPAVDLVLAAGEAMDLLDTALSGHHLRVATVASALGRQIGLPRDRLQDLAIAAALHDAGAFSLAERLETLEFELARPEHAEAGWLLLRGFGPFARAARIVRHHHLPWEGGRGERSRGEAVPLEAHLLNLSDRVTVLLRDPVRPHAAGRAALARAREGAGTLFVPELVEALGDAAAAERFWPEAAAGSRAAVAGAVAGAAPMAIGQLRGLARVLWQLIDFRSRFTATHSSGVVAVARHLAPLCGADEETAGGIGIAAGLHDLGKLAVPGELLDTEDRLCGGARELMRAHPYHGWRVLGRVRGLEAVNAWASFHHERLDGSGYPFGLTGARLPLGSRVVAVADVFTALTEERPYRRGRSAREAAAVLEREAGRGRLDGAVVAETVRRRDDLDSLRRDAQQAAGGRFLEFRGRARARESLCGAPAA